MSNNKADLTRRDFFKATAAIGLGSLLARGRLLADGNEAKEKKKDNRKEPQVPTRKFGNSKRKVSILSLGGIFDITTNQLMLIQALKYGVTYWDTAASYTGGKSELGIGKFFKKNPAERKKIFLVTKSGRRDPKGMDKLLARSLERMNTDYIDLYFIHGVGNGNEVANHAKAWKAWSEKQKKAGKIKLFGFSTHSNMASCLEAAAKAGCIDGIMLTYNYRIMHNDKMKKAVDVATKAGIGLTAMKTQGGGQVKTTNETELKLAGKFLNKGFSQHQARLKALWEDKRISALCSQMPNVNTLMANIAAALDKTKLNKEQAALLRQYAAETCSGYCAGCSEICEQAAGDKVPIADVMRYLMYYDDYGDRDRARQLFGKLPASVKRRLVRVDFTPAERACPQGMEIGKLMKQAAKALA